MKKVLLTLLSLGIISHSLAQQRSPTSISSAGGIAKTNSISIAWSLGEFSTESSYIGNKMFTEGFHQPVLQVDLLEDLNAFDMTTYPNPVVSKLHIQFSAPPSDMILRVLDLRGSVLIQRLVTSTETSIDLDLSNLPEAIHILRLTSRDGSISKSVKVSIVH